MINSVSNLKISFLIIASLSVAIITAQDIHYSQYYEAPLAINPAFTGAMEGAYRIGALYRSQWSSVVKPNVYSTPSIFADFDLFDEKIRRGSFGLGAMFLNDNSAGNKIRNLTGLVSLSYHLDLDKEENYFLSFGLQSGIVHKTFKSAEFIYANQIDGNGNIDPNVQGEILDNNSLLNADLRAGLVFSANLTNNTNVKVGATILHLLKQNESVVSGSFFLPKRYISHFSLSSKIGSLIVLRPHFLYMYQAQVNQLNLGLNIGFRLKDQTELYIGGACRLKDAFIATLGFEYKGFRIGTSYDFNNSNLQSISNSKGGYEISVSFTKPKVKDKEITTLDLIDNRISDINTEEVGLKVSGLVVEYKNGEAGGPITNASISLRRANEKTGEWEVVSKNIIDGENYEIYLPRGYDYQIEAGKEGYLNESNFVSTKDMSENDEKLRNIVLKPKQKNLSFRIENIVFDYDQVDLSQESKLVLNDLVSLMELNTDIKIEIGSHTDSKGSEEYNLILSQKRSDNVINYLISAGISEERLQAKGYGESEPLKPNTNPDGSDNLENMALNRRTEFKLL